MIKRTFLIILALNIFTGCTTYQQPIDFVTVNQTKISVSTNQNAQGAAGDCFSVTLNSGKYKKITATFIITVENKPSKVIASFTRKIKIMKQQTFYDDPQLYCGSYDNFLPKNLKLKKGKYTLRVSLFDEDKKLIAQLQIPYWVKIAFLRY